MPSTPSKFIEQFRKGWNAFLGRDPTPYPTWDLGPSYQYRPDRNITPFGNEKTIINSIYDRIATDVSAIKIKHIKCDDQGRYLEDMDSYLNDCFTLSTNKDQIPRAFFKDVVLTMLNNGVVAIVPTAASADIRLASSFDIYELRTARIVEWFPNAIKVDYYNDRTGQRQQDVYPKSSVGIIENPFYSVMNAPDSTVRRINAKLAILDQIDQAAASNKLDIIIKLPYNLRGESKKAQAEQRRKDIEVQLSDSKYGVAYIDQSESITQLNRAAENHILDNITYLTNLLYSQMSMNEALLNDTADERVTLNYRNNVLEPIVSAIVDEMRRKFLTKSAITKGQDIKYFMEPFKLVPVDKIADIADKFTRNAILSSNEIRQIVGFEPVDDPDADALRNKNLNQSKQELDGEPPMTTYRADDKNGDTRSREKSSSKGLEVDTIVELVNKLLKGVKDQNEDKT